VHGGELLQQVVDERRVLAQVHHELLEAAQPGGGLEPLAAQMGWSGHHGKTLPVQALDVGAELLLAQARHEVGQRCGGDLLDGIGVGEARVALDLRVVAPVVVGAQNWTRADVGVHRQRLQVPQEVDLLLRLRNAHEADIGLELDFPAAPRMRPEHGRVEVDHPGHAVGLLVTQHGLNSLAWRHSSSRGGFRADLEAGRLPMRVGPTGRP